MYSLEWKIVQTYDSLVIIRAIPHLPSMLLLWISLVCAGHGGFRGGIVIGVIISR